jgi:hypothetical protein
MDPEREIRELNEKLREARSERDAATEQNIKFKLKIWELTAELERRTEIVRYVSKAYFGGNVERTCEVILSRFENEDV